MKKRILFYFLIAIKWGSYGQTIKENVLFEIGEELHFKITYGIFNTSIASLKVNDTLINNISNYKVIAHGETTGLAKLFFNVNDNYFSVFSKNIKPIIFGRSVKEGDYYAEESIYFNENKALFVNNLDNTTEEINVSENIQDIISAFYFFRTVPKEEIIAKNTVYKLPMIYNEEGEFTFELRYIGEETIKTQLGLKQCYKFKPYLPNLGRIFKDPNAITIWVTKDENRIPVKVSAKIVVGTIHAELMEVKKPQNN